MLREANRSRLLSLRSRVSLKSGPGLDTLRVSSLYFGSRLAETKRAPKRSACSRARSTACQDEAIAQWGIRFRRESSCCKTCDCGTEAGRTEQNMADLSLGDEFLGTGHPKESVWVGKLTVRWSPSHDTISMAFAHRYLSQTR